MERFTHDTYPISEREKKGAAISRTAATESMVLLRNDKEVLPLKEDATIALYGVGAARTVRGGTGSGDPFNGGLSGGGDAGVNQSKRYHINVFDSFTRLGFNVVNPELSVKNGERYDRLSIEEETNHMSVFACPEELLTNEEVAKDAEKADTAVFILSRNSGEGSDRHLTGKNAKGEETGDYKLSASEKENLALIRKNFAKLVIVLNVGSPVDMAEINSLNPDSVLLMGQAGQEGGDALYMVITGKVNPSGKLTDTWAADYNDYPASATFAGNDGDSLTERYTEGIYVGYRYFDSFGKKSIYEFGYGLSYTTFDVAYTGVKLEGENAIISVKVKNTGKVAGKEVVQVYTFAPADKKKGLDTPVKELKGFEKTSLLESGKEEELTVTLPIRSLASFDEGAHCYRIFEGEYGVAVGTSSLKLAPAFKLKFAEEIVTEEVYAEVLLNEELSCIKAEKAALSAEWAGVPVVEFTGKLDTKDSRSKLHEGRITTYTTDKSYKAVMDYEDVKYVEAGDVKLADVMSGKKELGDLVAQMSLEELATFVCGSGWGVADEANPIIGANSESCPGAAGETTHILEDKFGIPSVVLADGPGGVRITQIFEAKNEQGEPVMGYHFCTAWPVGSLLAQSFDRKLWYEVGCGMAEDCKAFNIALLLGPGMNIHRDPLGGRNFEYFSEDPFLTGICTAELTKGIQCYPETGACIKHYACNNQETERHRSNSIVSERALREIYLKPFEIAIKEGSPKSIMTSYNLVNGVYTAESYDLCSDLARGEWGFDGLIMTDWNGGSADTYKAIHAGNDLIMPGGSNKVLSILLALKTIEPEFDGRGQVVMEMQHPFPVANAKWNSFTVSKDGKDTMEAELKGEHTCEVKDGVLYVDGEVLYTEAGAIFELFRDRENFKMYKTPATTEVASFSADNKKVIYKGTLDRTKKIAPGDVQRCAMGVLTGIMRLTR